jgi:hypothetical protein
MMHNSGVKRRESDEICLWKMLVTLSAVIAREESL